MDRSIKPVGDTRLGGKESDTTVDLILTIDRTFVEQGNWILPLLGPVIEWDLKASNFIQAIPNGFGFLCDLRKAEKVRWNKVSNKK